MWRTDSPLIVSKSHSIADMELHIVTDNVTENVEDFTVSLEVTDQHPPTSFTTARNEFFVDTIKIYIKDETGEILQLYCSATLGKLGL